MHVQNSLSHILLNSGLKVTFLMILLFEELLFRSLLYIEQDRRVLKYLFTENKIESTHFESLDR